MLDQHLESALVTPIFRLILLGLTVALTSCSVLESDKVDYKSTGKLPSLIVPPDLTQLSRESRYAVPGGSVTASNFKETASSPSMPISADSVANMRIERMGNHRWLVVNRPPEALWQSISDFWKESGFLLVTEKADLGIMETDWAENRAKIPQDFIRNALGKVLDSLYSTGERDKYRTRLERNSNGGTDIFVSHRGMVEVYTDGSQGTTVWQPRAPNPELEVEFLRRVMIRLGAQPEQVKALQATSTVAKTSRIDTSNGLHRLQIDEDIDRAWRRVGLSLDRTGFTVEDRDRNKGLYFVRYVEPSADKSGGGFLSRLIGKDKPDSAVLKFRIALSSNQTSTIVAVQTPVGAPDNSANAQRILKVIADDLQ